MSAEQPSTLAQQKKKKLTATLIGVIVALVAVNVGAYFFSGGIDLTSDKRYTTTNATQTLLKKLDQDIEITVFLTGKQLPAAFQRLAKSTEDVLYNFQSISNKKINYTFSDPQGDDTTVYETLQRFRMQGIPVTISAGKQGTTQQMVFPWVLVHNKVTNVALPVFLQETNTPQLSRTVLNRSEMLLEYNIANAIAQVSKKSKEKIAFLLGNDEHIGMDMVSALGALGTYYYLDTLNINQVSAIPDQYDLLIVNNPEVQFDAVQQYKIDQYLVNGGNVIMSINGAYGTLDSFNAEGRYNAINNDVNLGPLLFHYGLRINNDVIADGAEHEMVPLSATGNPEESILYPWVYYPVLKANEKHPITKNLEAVLGRISSSITLVENDQTLNKTVLLSTSKYTKLKAAPVPLELTEAIIDINTAEYKESNVPVAVLVEGSFNSFFAQQMPTEVAAFAAQSGVKNTTKDQKEGKLLVIADGEIFANEISRNGPMDLGEYKYGSFKYDNKNLLLNSVEYLANEQHLLEARGKQFTNRILDPKRVQRERSTWQMINILVPALSIIILGGAWFLWRKKKYS